MRSLCSLSRYDIFLLIGKPLPNHATIAWLFFYIKKNGHDNVVVFLWFYKITPLFCIGIA